MTRLPTGMLVEGTELGLLVIGRTSAAPKTLVGMRTVHGRWLLDSVIHRRHLKNTIVGSWSDLGLPRYAVTPNALDTGNALLRAIEGRYVVAFLMPQNRPKPENDFNDAAFQQRLSRASAQVTGSASENLMRMFQEVHDGPWIGQDLKAVLGEIISKRGLLVLAGSFLVLGAAHLVGIGEIADLGIAYWAYTTAGFAGLWALGDMVTALLMAARADNPAKITKAAETFAKALVVLGVAILTIVITWAGRRASGARRSAPEEAPPDQSARPRPSEDAPRPAAKPRQEPAAKPKEEPSPKARAEEPPKRAPKPKPRLKENDVDTYGNLKKKPGSGSLDRDHIPSKAALKARAAELKGGPLTAAEEAAVENSGMAVAVPKGLHQAGRTYGARNTPAQIAGDARNLHAAAAKDAAAYSPGSPTASAASSAVRSNSWYDEMLYNIVRPRQR